MTSKEMFIRSYDVDPAVFFLGTDQEVEALEALEAKTAAELQAVLFCRDFIAMEYYTENGARRILHRSTRPGVLFQLSYIDADGVPVMHENYISAPAEKPIQAHIGTKEDLYKHFIDQLYFGDLRLYVITRKGATA
jgi:hypothetical protein